MKSMPASVCSIARHPQRRWVAAAAALGCAFGAANAQTIAPPVAAASSPDAVLAPVTVKGARDAGTYRSIDVSAGVLGELKLLDSPFSINVITRKLLDDQQATTYGDFLKNDPAAAVGNVPVGFMNLRGFSVGTDGHLFDGLSGNVALSDGRWQLEGIERIEVLKGPSAFLYGLGAATSLGGTINFVPKQPAARSVRSLTVGYATQSLYSITADLGDRFGGDHQFGYRLNVGFKEGEQAVDGYDWSHRVATLALNWNVSSDVVISGGYEYGRNRFPRLRPFYVPGPGLTAVPDAPSGKARMAQPWDDFITVGQDVYVRADWQIAPDWSLTAQWLASSDNRPQTKEARLGTIDDALGNTTLIGREDISRTTGRSAQILLHGKLRAAAIEHQLTAGITAGRSASASSSNALGLFPSNLYTPVDGAEPASAGTLEPLPTQQSRSSSLLLSDIVKFNHQWSVLLGARHAKLTVDNLDGQPIETAKTSPTAALMFKPTPESLVYLNYSEGLEQGGKAPAGTANQDQLLAPIKTRQIELGAKIEVNGMTLTAALFDLKKPFEYVDAGTNTFVQNGIQRHRGAELTLTGSVTNDLSVVAGTMLLEPTTRNTGNPATDGKRPVGVPQLTGNLYADWRLATVPGLYLNGGVYYAGKQYLDPANDQTVPSWRRFDIGARYETRINNLRTTFLLGIENLADRSYWAGALSGILTLAEPRTVKLTARFDL